MNSWLYHYINLIAKVTCSMQKRLPQHQDATDTFQNSEDLLLYYMLSKMVNPLLQTIAKYRYASQILLFVSLRETGLAIDFSRFVHTCTCKTKRKNRRQNASVNLSCCIQRSQRNKLPLIFLICRHHRIVSCVLAFSCPFTVCGACTFDFLLASTTLRPAVQSES